MKKRNLKNATLAILAAARRRGIISKKGDMPSIYWVAERLIEDLGIEVIEGKRERLVALSDIILGTAKAAKDRRVETPSRPQKDEFYRSWEWRTVRMIVLKKYGYRCQSCGARPLPENDVVLAVDHIKPLSKHWGLRLDPNNLQVLCDACNMGKGAWDETDHRTA